MTPPSSPQLHTSPAGPSQRRHYTQDAQNPLVLRSNEGGDDLQAMIFDGTRHVCIWHWRITWRDVTFVCFINMRITSRSTDVKVITQTFTLTAFKYRFESRLRCMSCVVELFSEDNLTSMFLRVAYTTSILMFNKTVLRHVFCILIVLFQKSVPWLSRCPTAQHQKWVFKNGVRHEWQHFTAVQ